MLIGTYIPRYDIKKMISEEKSYYMASEAFMQGCELIFFTLDDVDFERKKIKGFIRKDGNWEETINDFPDVLINQGIPINELLTEEMSIREDIPITNVNLPEKKKVFKKIKEGVKYAEYLLPYDIVDNISTVNSYLDKYEQIVLKPSFGRQGQNIYFIYKEKNKYIVKGHTNKHVLNQKEFEKLIKRAKEGNYIVQPYVECRTKLGNPFDFRVHVQKDGRGQWTITRLYPRIGHKDSILSNVSRGGMVSDIDYFLYNEFLDKAAYWKKKLEDLGLDIVKHMEELYNKPFNDFGVDLAIDKDEKIWLYEVNSGPQGKYHEALRAKNIIAYAKYVANKYKDETFEVMESLSDTVLTGLVNLYEDLLDGVTLIDTARTVLNIMEGYFKIERKLYELTGDFVGSYLQSLTQNVKNRFDRLITTYEQNDITSAISIIELLIEEDYEIWREELYLQIKIQEEKSKTSNI